MSGISRWVAQQVCGCAASYVMERTTLWLVYVAGDSSALELVFVGASVTFSRQKDW